MKKRLPVVAALPATPGGRAKPRAGGWTAFSDGGTAPRWVLAARVVMTLALAATIPAILNLPDGNRLVWTVAIAALPFFWMTFGYYLWRRICPLAVAGQLGRLLGRPGTRKMGEWMNRNYLLVQLALMFVALTLRLVATNGSDVWLAGFLGAVVIAAITTSFVYGGKTWCNFICPVGMVEKIHTEPARSAIGAGDGTSQCQPCVACKKHCPDIDLEQGYWKEMAERPRRIAYFAWPGMVVAFYVYFRLVSGGWDYYFSGQWAYERDLPSKALSPGFTFAPSIARVVAAPLTLAVFGAASYALFAIAQGIVTRRRLAHLAPDASDDAKAALVARVRHGSYAVAGLVAFNAFYLFAGQPTLRHLPAPIVAGWGVLVVFASTAMFVRRVTRREDAYVHEKFAQKILRKWEWGDAPPSDDLKDIYLLHTERTKQREARMRAYKETVRELVADGLVTRGELVILDSLRAQLGITDKDHAKIVGELSAEERQLFDPAYHGSVEQRIARQHYHKDLERLIVEAARAGSEPTAAALASLRTEHGVDLDEQARQVAEILAPGGPIGAMYTAELGELTTLAAAIEAASPPDGTDVANAESASLALLRHLARDRARDHAVHALGLLGVVTKRPELAAVRQAIATKGVRGAALGALDPIAPALRIPLTDVLARIAAQRPGTLAAAPLLAVSADASRHLRAVIAMLLSRFEDEPARAKLIALLDDPDAIVRESAVRALGASRRLTRDLLSRALADAAPGVRQAAVRAVAGTSSPDLPAIDPAIFAQTAAGAGKPGMYATLDANATMAQLTTIEKMMLIRQVPIFGTLEADDLEELAAEVEERKTDAGKDIFREGDVGDAVYLIVRGKVRVFTGGPGGGGDRPERTLSELGPGACIGEMAVLDAAPRSATVRAIERTRTLRVPGEGFKHVLATRPEMSEAIVAELVRRMRGMLAQSDDRAATPGDRPAP